MKQFQYRLIAPNITFQDLQSNRELRTINLRGLSRGFAGGFVMLFLLVEYWSLNSNVYV